MKPKIRNKLLRIAVSKIDFRYCDSRRWVGEFTNSEILLLIYFGVRYPKDEQWKVDQAEENLKKGISYTTWFYFEPKYSIIAKK
jgi:hypothetical protein